MLWGGSAGAENQVSDPGLGSWTNGSTVPFNKWATGTASSTRRSRDAPRRKACPKTSGPRRRRSGDDRSGGIHLNISSVKMHPILSGLLFGIQSRGIHFTSDFYIGHWRARLIPRRPRGRARECVADLLAHDPHLRILLRKLFHRARLRIPLYARRRRFATGFETPERAWASLAAAASVPALATAFVSPWGLLLPGVLIAASIAGDSGMYRFVRHQRGAAFVVHFAAVHYLVNLTIVTGAVAGALQWTASRAFRGLYDRATPANA
jgi:hypothetical protein